MEPITLLMMQLLLFLVAWSAVAYFAVWPWSVRLAALLRFRTQSQSPQHELASFTTRRSRPAARQTLAAAEAGRTLR